MNKILMAAAGALLVSGSSLAFAANSASVSNIAPTTQHCSNLETQFQGKPVSGYSAARKQTAELNAMSLCRQDRHMNGGVARIGEAVRPSRAS